MIREAGAWPPDFLWQKSIIEITESGCSYLDSPYEKEDGHVPDARRIDFFRAELAELSRAISDGANVRAFHAWSLLDNFEWADGYSQRYGLNLCGFPRPEAHRERFRPMVWESRECQPTRRLGALGIPRLHV